MNAPNIHLPQRLQRRVSVSGTVQGVGFRPYVWRLATELGLDGWVCNDGSGVVITIGGEAEAIRRFTERLPAEAPPLARVQEVVWQESSEAVASGFQIRESRSEGPATTMIGPDSGVCPECLAELFDPAERRFRYPFINCTHCGPRYTLTRALPYDRAQTSMARFSLCPACASEYGDPADRRFHAEPTACPVCGPRLWLSDPEGNKLAVADPIAETLARLQAGAIVAVKGLGGFHLVCDARNAEAVARLRQRKQRDERPFAIMVANSASLRDWAEFDSAAEALLDAAERPIVLLRKRAAADRALPGIAPGLAWLGAMLPYTPLHWLLFHEAAGSPAGTVWTEQPHPLALVMTSANPGGEPLVYRNEEAVARLGGIADLMLLHDRDIVVRCDDSVVRSEGAGMSQFIRRARGYTPRAIPLARPGPAVLAMGGQFKNTVCLTRGAEAFLSQHIGSLTNPATCAVQEDVVEHLLAILEVRPQAVAYDRHPDFFSTRLALELAARFGVPAIAVQHHHAHLAAVAAEHGHHQGPLLGLALDGVGLGDDDAAWGGELLLLDGGEFERLGHLQPLKLPGGDIAAREPWRMAAAALFALGRGEEIAQRFANQKAAGRRLADLLARGLNSPATSSMGRWFDAAVGLLGLCPVMSYEGQAAMTLEGLAEAAGEQPPLAGGYRLHGDGRLDLLPLLAWLADARQVQVAAAVFHSTVAAALADWLTAAAERSGIGTVALGGGCFLNHLLTRQLTRRLAVAGLKVLTARQAPPNDGGLSLGQAWVAIQQLNRGDDRSCV